MFSPIFCYNMMPMIGEAMGVVTSTVTTINFSIESDYKLKAKHHLLKVFLLHPEEEAILGDAS